MRGTRAFVALLLATSLVSAARSGQTHPAIGAPTAYPTVPSTVGTVVSSTFTITWLDYNRPIATGTATIDWYYVTENPRTYLIGAIPEDLTGELIVSGIDESDTTNEYVWDVSGVPSGSYFIWSKVNEPPEEIPVLELFSFSQGVVTVHHPGDPVYPAVCFNRPDNPFTLVDESLALVLESFDPDGTGRLKLELFSRDAPDEMITLFEDRPAQARIEEPLDTSALAEGDYGLRFSIIDARGLGFSAYTRWFFRVTHRLEEPDAGPADSDATATEVDAGAITDLGVSDQGTGEPDPEGCGCVANVTPGRSSLGPAILLFGWAFARRRRISDAGRGSVG